ncbi:MAG: STM3941 family protein [Janthinobacterium lividum]
MEDFVAYPSRWRIALLGLGSFAFVAIGLWMIGAFGTPPVWSRTPATVTFLVGWSSVVFFSLCGMVSIKRLFDTSEYLRIGPTGVHSSLWSNQTIPWSEIIDVTTWSFRAQKAIILHLREAKRFPAHGAARMLSGSNRMLTGGDVSIALTGTDRGFEEAMSAIVRFRSQSSHSQN